MLDLLGGSATMELNTVVDILLLSNIVFVSISECYSEIVQHIYKVGIYLSNIL